MPGSIDAIVAGHICLDLLPTFPESAVGMEGRGLRPGALYHVGQALRSTGGAVANTGLALHRLGVKVSLMGKIGDDPFGKEILGLVQAHGQHLAEGMKISPGATSSYSVVISPPGGDRIFLHCPGCNDSFGPEDLDEDLLCRARLFHFGYPPLMRRMYENDGEELARVLTRAKRCGLTTSLDMALPDPASLAGQANWNAILHRVLPLVDVFHPSIEELLFMLDRPRWDGLMKKGCIDIASDISVSLLNGLSRRLIQMGVAIVLVKLGNQGAYLRVTGDLTRLQETGRAGGQNLLSWAGKELTSPCLQANFVGSTGAGDCTIAGLLCALLRGCDAAESLQLAVAVGACSVERADATSGVPHCSAVQARLQHGWSFSPSVIRIA